MKTAASITMIETIPALEKLCQNADHIDVKRFTGTVTLREFLAGMLFYNSLWIKFLYAIRWGFVRLLGMKQAGVRQESKPQPQDISFTPGDAISFFEVKAAAEDHYYIAGSTESHLTAHLAVVREGVANPENIESPKSRFYVITIVHYHRWTGPVYFNVIRPFHHLVVSQMGKAGIKSHPQKALF